MKTLKFMLAAATAIGLASATQANEFNTTGFEKLAVGTSVTTGVEDNRSGYSYFYYAGSVAEDNESVIAEGTPSIGRPRGAAAVDESRTNILQVSTGTDPLMRTYAPLNGNTPQSPTAISSDVYVDTLVQFTVTPYTDTVTPGSADKLMIYLKESVTTNELGEITDGPTTNLVVVGGFFNGATTVAKEYGLNTGSVSVNPNEWHRLTVKAIVDISGDYGARLPGFQIWVDGELCTLANGALTYDALNSDALDLFGGFSTADDIDNGKIVLSLLAAGGEQTATLQGVGFAGEGKVDDIVFSELDPFATVYDFTFAFDAAKVSAIEYTVAGTSYSYARVFPEVTAGTEVQITSITYADEWLAGTIDAVNMSDPVAGVYTVTNAGASLTITPKVFFPRTETADQDGTAEHPYEVADAAALSALQEGVLAGKTLTGVNFVQTGNIDMTGVTDFYGIGWFKSSDSYASLPPGLPSASTDKPFTGVYDGGGYKISNVRLVRHNYAGVFNCVEGTVKNLTVENLGFVDTSAGEWGCGIVGNAQGNAILEYLTAATSAQNGFWGDNAPHNTAGIAARAEDSATIRYCVNNAAITASAKRLGGIISFTGTAGSASDVVSIIGCTNNGALYSSNGTRGVGGIIASPESSTAGSMTLIKDCANFGTLTAGSSGFTGEIVGSMGVNANSTWQDDGGNTYLASGNLVGTRGSNTKAIVGLAYALPTTINAQNYLTTVAQADLAAGNQYTLLANVAASETPVFTLQAAGDWIAFYTNNFSFAGTIAGAAGLTVTPEEESGVITYTAASAGGNDWVDDYTTVTNQTVAEAYTELAGTALATANAGELTEWAKTNNVDFATAAATIDAAPELYTEAFLLNCAPTAAAVADEKEDFVLDISVAADGTITVSLPEDKKYNGRLQMKGSNDLSTWTNVSEASSSYKFYKYELSL